MLYEILFISEIVYAEEYTSDYNYTYSTTATGIRLSIDTDKRNLIIPDKINGNPVKKIGYVEFKNEGKYSITIPETVTEIGDGAFSHYNNANSWIVNVQIPNSVERIESNAFQGNNIEEVTIPESVEYIGKRAFACRTLKKVTILSKKLNMTMDYHKEFNPFDPAPSDLEIYGYKGTWAENCADYLGYKFVDIESIDEPQDPSNPGGEVPNPQLEVDEFIEEGIVYSIDNINKTATVKGLTEEGKEIERYKEKLTIPGVITVNNENIVVDKIGEGAFENLTLKLIDFPSTISTIEKNAFHGVKELNIIVLPKNLKTIGDRAFANCNDLNYIYIPPTVTEISPSIFENDDYLMIYGYKNSLAETYTNSLEIVCKYNAVDDTKGRGDCVIDGIIYELNEENATATVVGTQDNINFIIFDNYKPVKVPTKITVNEKDYYVKTIATEAISIDCLDVILENCEEIEVGYGIETIEENAFKSCDNLKSIEIPETVSSMNINSFYSLGKFTLNISPQNPYYECDYSDLYNKNKTILYGKYQGDTLSDFTVPESVKEIKSYTAKSITIGKNVTKIENEAVKADEIRGYIDSYAEEYAQKNSIPFVPLDEKVRYFEFFKDNFNFTNSENYFVDDSTTDEEAYTLRKYEKNLENALLQEMKDYGIKYKGWKGACSGFSVAVQLLKKDILTPEFWQSDSKEATCTYDIEEPNVNLNVRDLITFYQVFQKASKKYSAQVLVGETNDVEDIYNCVKDYYNNGKNKNSILQFSYGLRVDGELVGHVVSIIGEPESIDDSFFKYHSPDIKEYAYRIPIYDPNDTELRFLYIKEDFENISLGYEDSIIETEYNKEGELNKYIKLTHMQVRELLYWKVINLEETIKKGEKIGRESNMVFIESNLKSSVTISNEDGEYINIEGESLEKEGNLEADVDMIINDTVEGNSDVKYYSVALDKNEKYYVETKNDTDELDVSIQFGDSYMTAKTKAGGKAVFENKKSVTLTNPSGQEYETKITLNDEFLTLPWYTITASGMGATDLKLEIIDGGVLVSGNSLEDLTIKGNNSDETVEINVNTRRDNILIRANDEQTKLIAYIDEDGDGLFETPLKFIEDKNLAVDDEDENNQKEDGNSQESAKDKLSIEKSIIVEKNVQTGDNIVFVISVLVVAVIVIVVIEVKVTV